MPIRKIVLSPSNGEESVLTIDCGFSDPKLGGEVYLSQYTNLKTGIIVAHDILGLYGYENNPNLEFLNCNTNKLSGNLPDLSELTNLHTLTCYRNQFTGPLNIANLYELTGVYCYENKFSSFTSFDNSYEETEDSFERGSVRTVTF